MDALGNPLRLILTAGQRHDSPQAGALIDGFEPQVLIADKGYHSAPLVESVTARGILAVIPPKKNRLAQRDYDQHLYRARHLIECFINKLKHYRRVFARFEKLSTPAAFQHMALRHDIFGDRPGVRSHAIAIATHFSVSTGARKNHRRRGLKSHGQSGIGWVLTALSYRYTLTALHQRVNY